jgi:predicted fused transcriptional regulator/phosphomethylpyrimidine kinase/predicted transcriptional regulator
MDPLEFSSNLILPPIRALISIRLFRKGNSQMRIAKILGVTQPAIHQYLKMSEEELVAKLNKIGVRKYEIDELISRTEFLADKEDYEAIMKEIISFNLSLLRELRLCSLHRKKYPQIPVSCTICSNINFVLDEPLRNLEEAIKILESSKNFHLLFPEVLVNLVEARKGVSRPEEVYGIPGRIVKIGNRVYVHSKPTKGGSTHLSKVLVTVMKKTNFRSAINIRYDKRVEHCARALGINCIKLPRREIGRDEELINMISKINGNDFDCIIDQGGFGIEPVTYIFGKTSIEIARLIERLADCYSIMVSSPIS